MQKLQQYINRLNDHDRKYYTHLVSKMSPEEQQALKSSPSVLTTPGPNALWNGHTANSAAKFLNWPASLS